MIKIIAAVALAQFALTDQFDHKVEWGKFDGVPKILVFAGKKASEQGRALGVRFQKEFNESFAPTSEHLQSRTDAEKVKIIAVVALPDIPKLFHSMVRSGFKKAAPHFGMALDYGSKLSGAFGYDQASGSAQVVAISRAGEAYVIIPDKGLTDDAIVKKLAQTLGL